MGLIPFLCVIVVKTKWIVFFLILHLHSIWPVQEPLTQLCLENGIYPFQNESICPAASFPPFLSSSPSLYTLSFVANRAIIPPHHGHGSCPGTLPWTPCVARPPPADPTLSEKAQSHFQGRDCRNSICLLRVLPRTSGSLWLRPQDRCSFN